MGEKEEKELEESNISTYKRYSKLILSESGYPNIILSDKLYLGDGRQAMNWTVIYNLKITHILNVTRLCPNQFDGKHSLDNIVNIKSVKEYFVHLAGKGKKRRNEAK